MDSGSLQILSPRIDLAPSDVEGRKASVIIATTLVLVASIVSYALRLWARKLSSQKFMPEDYVMGLALPFSFIPAVCLLYG